MGLQESVGHNEVGRWPAESVRGAAGAAERPLLAGVVWPTLPADTFADLAGLDVLLSAVFLQRLGAG